MKWAGHVARMGIREMYKGFWLGNLKGRGYLRDPDVGGSITSKWLLKNRIRFIWLRTGTCIRLLCAWLRIFGLHRMRIFLE